MENRPGRSLDQSRLRSVDITAETGFFVLMTGQINVLQYGRAIAALAVVLHHAGQATRSFDGTMPQWVEAACSRGFLGVDFFFVLSGFIITHAHMNDARGGHTASLFLRKRLTRIYVPYLPVSIGMMALYSVLPSFSAANRDWSAISSLLLLPTDRPPALSVAWTLVHEMFFYSLFLASYFTRHFVVLVCGWTAAIMVAWAAHWVPTASFSRVALAPINLEFVAGVGAALAVRRLPASWWAAFVAAGVCTAALMIPWEDEGNARVWFGLSLAPLVVGLVLMDCAGAIPTFRWALILGDASYAIYLVHNPLASLAARLVAFVHLWQVALAACVAAGLAGGILYHFLIEKPALAWSRLISVRAATMALSSTVHRLHRYTAHGKRHSKR